MIRVKKEQRDLMKVLLAYIKDHKKDIETDIFDEIANSSDYDTYIDDEGHEILGDYLGKKWQSYYSDDYRRNVIVKNIKGRGFPDFEDVLDKVEKQLPDGVTREGLEEYCTEEFFDGLLWDDVNFTIEGIQYEYPNFVVVGRSGGYWGLDVDIYDAFILNDKVVDKKVDNILNNFEKMFNAGELVAFYTYQGSETVVEDFFDDDLISVQPNTITDIVMNTILAENTDATLAEMLLLSEETKVMFEELDEIIEATIKDFESSERWVETIIANEYWHPEGEEEIIESKIKKELI